MLLDEAKIGLRVTHPNVVSIIDVIREADQVALVMDYVHGESLHALAVRHAAPLAPDLACGIAVQVLGGLEAVHALHGPDGTHLQVVHRDLSPHNILVDTEGLARVTDFGIAKSMANSHVTAAGHMKGKLAYMAPEQILAKGDQRIDLFAMAIVLWELVTGKRLFSGADQAELIFRIVGGGPCEDPRLQVPSIPPELARIILRGLEKSPSSRYQSAREMREEIEQGCTTAAPPAIRRWVRSLASDDMLWREQRAQALSNSVEEEPATVADLTRPNAAPPMRTAPYATPALPFFLAELTRRGVDLTPLLARYGVNPKTPSLSPQLLETFADACAQSANDPLLAVSVAQGVPRGGHGLVEFLLRSSANVEVAILETIRFAPVVSRIIVSSLEPGPQGRVRWMLTPRPGLGGRHSNEYLIAHFLRQMRVNTGTPDCVEAVGFKHERHEFVAELETMLGVPCHFSQPSNWLEFSAESLTLPHVEADPALFAMVCTSLEVAAKSV